MNAAHAPSVRPMRWILALLIWLAAPAPLYIWAIISLFI